MTGIALPLRPGIALRRPAPIEWALLAIALLALAVPLAVVLRVPRSAGAPPRIVLPSPRVIPRRELPPVEPMQLAAVTPSDARSINAAVPFSKSPNPAARPFRLTGSADDQARAVDCLAAGVYYEAGDDPVGQRAVAQVILNRVRHPAFPKSVCGVVFQGHTRRTGCQFTFTCDGAMRRIPSAAAWARARALARASLTGAVYAPVGLATHYHTDWVVPYWSSSLDKITEVHTHLFFRWTGWWGTPPAFRGRYAGVEPRMGKLGFLSPVHYVSEAEAAAAALDTGERTGVDVDALPPSALPPAADLQGDTFLVTLDRRMRADDFAALAIRTCGERPYCKFMGWTNGARRPTVLPASQAQLDAMSFSYLRDRAQGFGKALWNCAEFARPSAVQCMRQRAPQPVLTPVPRPLAPGAVAGGERVMLPGGLSGIRRRSDPAPVPSPVPSAAPSPATP